MKKNFMTWAGIFTLAGGLMGEHASAQEVLADSKSGELKISLLAVGDQPEITLTTTEKGSFYNDPPESEVPPSQLFVKVKGQFEAFPLVLNTTMEPIAHPGGAELKLFVTESDAADESKECFVKIPLPKEKADLTVFLRRNPATRNWRINPQAVPFKNDLVSFPLNSARVINFSSAVARVKLGDAIFELGPLASRIVKYPSESKGVVEYKIGVHGKDGPLMIADNAKSYYPNTRMNFVVYDSDGKNRKSQFSHVIFMERPPGKISIPSLVSKPAETPR